MADPLPVPMAGCLLCGRLGATLVTTSQPQSAASSRPVFQYDCPSCGVYEIRCIVGNSAAATEPYESADDVGAGQEASPVDMESAAVEHWTKAMESAERQRRITKRSTEPQSRPTNSDTAACA
jgi:hypothetical protein